MTYTPTENVATPVQPNATDELRSQMLAGFAILVALFVLIALFITHRNVERVFQEFEVERSLATRLASSPILILVLFVPTIAAIFISTNQSCARFANAWNIMLLTLSLIIVTIYCAGIVLPLSQLITSLKS